MIEKEVSPGSKQGGKSMKRWNKTLWLMLAVAFILCGCSASFETEQKEAQMAVEEVFKEKQKEVNKSNEFIEYYLPFGFEIEEETPNNILLKNGSKDYLLFYNQQEKANSEVVYQATVQQKKYDINETFQNDDRFGFLLIKKLSEDLNEVTVGFGGVKLTSEVETSNLKSEATSMMTIANSVKNK